MEQEKQESKEQSRSATEACSTESGSEQAEAGCRCKEAQGKTITDFLKVMVDDLAFWRKRS